MSAKTYDQTSMRMLRRDAPSQVQQSGGRRADETQAASERTSREEILGSTTGRLNIARLIQSTEAIL